MGLFVTGDGQHYRGWLAAFLCCCAAVNDDESPLEIEKDRSRPATTAGICNEQPFPLAELPATPLPLTLAAFKEDEPLGFYQPRHASRVSERPPSLKPLDLGEASLNPRWSLLGKAKSQSDHVAKPSISAPYAFRRLDITEPQRQSLVPLRLGPVVLRESPVPPETHGPADGRMVNATIRENSESTDDLLSEGDRRRSYRDQRETPFQRCQQRSSTMWPLPPPPVAVESSQRSTIFEAQRDPRPPISSRSSSSSLRRPGGGDGSAASSLSSRPSNERIRPKRKRSQQSVRKAGSDADDQELEKEVMELKTIVEERRAEAGRGDAPEQHVAAIAPSMRMRARAETLDAIGSALSRPLTAQSCYRTPASTLTTQEQPVLRRSTSATLRTSSRVSGWLFGIFPSSSTSHLPQNEPFYKCQPPPRPLQRSNSDNSLCSFTTETESPSLTAASSPTSKGHSRSHTGESRITPNSPAATYYAHGDADGRKGRDERWPVLMTPTSQVGLAL